MTLADRLRAALAAPALEPPLIGDLSELRAQAEVPAAVLIAVTDRPAPGLILTVRREHLRTHAGQIAFQAAASIRGRTPLQLLSERRTRRC